MTMTIEELEATKDFTWEESQSYFASKLRKKYVTFVSIGQKFYINDNKDDIRVVTWSDSEKAVLLTLINGFHKTPYLWGTDANETGKVELDSIYSLLDRHRSLNGINADDIIHITFI